MKLRTFKIIIGEEGNYKVKTGEETKGEVCNTQQEVIQNILGGVPIDEGYTDEYYEDEGVEIDIENLLGL